MATPVGLWVAGTLQTAAAKEGLLTPAVGHTSWAKPAGIYGTL